MSDTKYRVIADGNPFTITLTSLKTKVRYQVPRYSGWKPAVVIFKKPFGRIVRYQVPRYSGWKPWSRCFLYHSLRPVRYQVPRYSGWKHCLVPCKALNCLVRYQVPRYSGWKRNTRPIIIALMIMSDTKYRVIADGNRPIQRPELFPGSRQIPSTAL